jgi:GNAT superfamily N-acetyltransferase
VRIRVAGCGLCHTDLGFAFDGVRTHRPLPLILGHEIAGVVEATGPGAEAWLGQAVVVPAVVVRILTRGDLDRLVRMDQAWSGRNRAKYLEGKLGRALDADVRISVGAVVDGVLVGAILGTVHYGEYGLAEPIAILDTLLVDRAFRRRGVGRAMFDQIVKNLAALRIERIRTEVGWNEQELIGFLAAEGFAPAPRLVLERVVSP